MGQTEEEEEVRAEQRYRDGRHGLRQCGLCDRRGHVTADSSNVVRPPQWQSAVAEPSRNLQRTEHLLAQRRFRN